VNQASISLEGITAQLLVDRVLEAWNMREELKSRLAERVPELREAAEENIDMAANL